MKKSLNTKDLIMGGIFIALMVVSAKIQIPFPYVPLTFQLVVAVASGIFLGKYLAPLCMGIYLILGLVGLPIFSKGGGFGYFFTDSFGFILGFVLSAWVTGMLWDESKSKKILAILLGVLTTYVIGIPWFWWVFNFIQETAFSIRGILFVMSPYFVKDVALIMLMFGLMHIFDRYSKGVGK